jgi:hypothetical protein
MGEHLTAGENGVWMRGGTFQARGSTARVQEAGAWHFGTLKTHVQSPAWERVGWAN